MRFLDLFAGIGGFRLGMEMASHQCVGYVEWDKFARKSYEAIHNTEGEWTWDDVSTIDYRQLPRADCWCFGFPCQDISVAGKQTGFKGNRSSLFFAVTKRLRQIKEWDSEGMPSILFIENVKNFLSVNNGWDFLVAQIELDEIGYDCEWQVLNSKDFGVPQNRERVFIIGHLRGRSTRKVFPITGQGNEYTTIGKSTETTIARTFTAGGHSAGNHSGMTIIKENTVIQKTHGATTTVKQDETGTLQAARLDKIPMVVRPVLTPDREEKRQNGRRMKDDGEPMFTLTAQDKHGVAIIQKGHGFNDGGIKEIAPTLTKNAWEHNNHLTDGYRIRKLTPKECWRLQGFPDWAFDKAAEVNSDSQLYKQAGNSVTVNVIYEIAKRLEVKP